MATPRPVVRRVIAASVYALIIVAGAAPALVSSISSPLISPLNKTLLVFVTLGTAGGLVASATSRRFSLAWSTFWVWSFVFLALAPQHQLSSAQFPWRGAFDDGTVTTALLVVVVGCASVAVAQAFVSAGKSRKALRDIGREPSSGSGYRAVRSALSVILIAYVACAAVYIAITGAALFGGKAELQRQLVANVDIVGAGTLYFVSTAGAIVLPAVAVVARRNGVTVSWLLIALASALAFVVTNPLTGSRFLTGGFLLAIAGAIIAGRELARYLPAALGVALVTVFPSLDLMRGDGTGASSLAVSSPAEALVTFDFDSFEMLLRAVEASGQISAAETAPLALLIAPFLRWVPGLSQLVVGDATGPLVARVTGMGYTNVSMPLWGEAYIIGGIVGVVLVFVAFGVLFGLVRPVTPGAPLRAWPTRRVVDAPVAALIVLVLRGSLYDVLGYLLFAIVTGLVLWWFARLDRRQQEPAADLDRPRTVAFYLPQFHAIPENDRWWGTGFTEWVNVRRAKSMFAGHGHPRESTEIGEYDLTDVSVMHRQAEMAAANGVDAFCFYFYWFGGTRLLERPVEQYLSDGPDFPFCLSWANESWSRRWDGKDHESLISQDYGPTSAEDIFADFMPYLRDPRYLRVDGAAVLLVHRTDHLPDGREFAEVWHRLADEAGVGPLHLVAAETHPGIVPGQNGFDAVAEFPPVGANTLSAAKILPVKGLERSFRGRLMSYPRLARRYRGRPVPRFVRYRSVVPGWDNTARRGSAATVYLDASPASYRRWLSHARTYEQRTRGSSGLVFVNAWNEWAEGAHLEPDAANGRAYLEATRWHADAIADDARGSQVGLPTYGWARSLALAAAGSILQAIRRVRATLR
ncbi:glycoside hydrolase family 99-like domain-containing protein [Microbacterium sp. HJ5]